MSLIDALKRAVDVAAAAGHRAALVGGLAVSVRAEPRFTRDADLVIAVESDDEAEAVVRHYLAAGYRLQALLEQSGVERLSGARLVGRDDIEVDLLTASSGIEREIVDDAEPMEITPGFSMHVASVGHLIALKLLSVAPGRETDSADLRALAKVAEEVEWQRAEVAVALIEQRGFHRGRGLAIDLARLRESTVRP